MVELSHSLQAKYIVFSLAFALTSKTIWFQTAVVLEMSYVISSWIITWNGFRNLEKTEKESDLCSFSFYFALLKVVISPQEFNFPDVVIIQSCLDIKSASNFWDILPNPQPLVPEPLPSLPLIIARDKYWNSKKTVSHYHFLRLLKYITSPIRPRI